MAGTSHEDFIRPDPVTPGSNRNFGLVMGAAFLLLAVVRFWHRSPWWPLWAAIAVLFAATAWLAPRGLSRLNRVWFRFGLMLHKVVSPVVMGVLFFGVVTPIGLLMRAVGRRPLAASFDAAAATYWERRERATAPVGSMSKQF